MPSPTSSAIVSPDKIGVAAFTSEEDAKAKPLRPQSSVSFFSPARPDILRAVTASSGLWILRRNSSGDAAYQRSFSVQSIKYFWSHSWHGPARAKMLSLCLVHNFWPGLVCGGMAAALSSEVLVLLPLRQAPEPAAAAVLAVLSGLLVSIVALTLWPSQDWVFLDKACICQDSESLKRQGILSLGFMLKRSRTMIVLWDHTIFLRLWCIFEMAARLKLQQENPEVGSMKVMPAAYGTLMLTALLGSAGIRLAYYASALSAGSQDQMTLGSLLNETARTAGVVFIVCLAAGRAMQSNLKQIAEQANQLEQFSIKDAECFCCKHNHVDPDTGEALACDRKLIEGAVVDWFGNTEAFDSYARSAVKPLAVKTLMLPYRYAVLAGGMPSLWSYMGMAAGLAKAGRELDALDQLRTGLQAAFLANPVAMYILIAIWHVSPSRNARLRLVAQATACALTLGCLYFSVKAPELFLEPPWGVFVNTTWLLALVVLFYRRNI